MAKYETPAEVSVPPVLSIDRYTRINVTALSVFDQQGEDEFNGVDGRTLHAFARRGLVWFECVDVWANHKRYRGGLTPRGRYVLELLEPNVKHTPEGD